MALSTELAEHLKRPRLAGSLGPGASRGTAQNVACGDELCLELVPGPSGGLRVGYTVRGCGALIAVTSLCASRLEGLERSEAEAFEVAAVVADAGGLDRRGAHAAAVFARALAAALSS